MLASPTQSQSSISLRSDSTAAANNDDVVEDQEDTTANQTFTSSPRHPRYSSLHDGKNNNDNNDNNNVNASPAQSTSSSSTSANHTSSSLNSSYSRYTSQSQLDRVHDVLQDRLDQHHHQGSALQRLIAFLDNEDVKEDDGHNYIGSQPFAWTTTRHTSSSNSKLKLAPPFTRVTVEEDNDDGLPDVPHYNAHAGPTTPPSQYRFEQQQQASSREQSQVAGGEAVARSSSSTLHSHHHAHSDIQGRWAKANTNQETMMRQREYDPNPSRSGQQPVRYSPPPIHAHTTYSQPNSQAPERAHAGPSSSSPQQRDNHHHPSYPHKHTRPTANIIASTETQLEKLKREVEQLDELVYKLKLQQQQSSSLSASGSGRQYNAPYQAHIDYAGARARHLRTHDATLESGPAAQARTEDDQHLQSAEVEQNPTRQNIGSANQKAAEAQAKLQRQRQLAFEAEQTPASHTDVIHLIRYLDSLIWMRRPTSPSFASPSQSSPSNSATLLGYGNRSDEIIFTKGNLDHLARRFHAWEQVVRAKEEIGRFKLHP